jgi:hypothetical protein
MHGGIEPFFCEGAFLKLGFLSEATTIEAVL